MKKAITCLFLLVLWGITGLSPMQAQNCVTPTTFNSSSTAAGTATLSWNATSNAVDYEIRYRVIGSGVVPIYDSTTSPSITLSNLLPNTCYEYSLRPRCGGGNVGPWSVVQTFCVAGGPNGFCAVPSNITAVPDTASAFITWTGATNAMSYEIRYRQVGTSALSFATANNPAINLSGLMPNVCYEYSIRSICGPNNASDWVRGPNFCTVVGPPCQDPNNIVAIPDTMSATLIWTGAPNAMSYEVRYREIGTSALSFVSSTGPSAILPNLAPNTCYEYSVRTICGPNNTSDWVRGPDFCTLAGPTCAAPSNIAATATSSSSAVINWTGTGNAVSYEIRYRPVGTSALSFASSNTPSVTLANLLPATCYEYSVRTVCGPNFASNWILGPNFCTPNAFTCPDPTGIMASPGSTTATINWNGIAQSSGYEIRYRPVGTSALTFDFTQGPSIVLSNLMPNTCYEYSIRNSCSGIVFSDWILGPNFCTTAPNNPVDTIPPTAVCQSTTVFVNNNGAVTVTPNMIDGGSFDNVGIVSARIDGMTSLTLTCADLGIRQVTLSVTDSSGNVGRCVTTVTVVDTIPPVVNCVGMYTAYLNPNGIAVVGINDVVNGSTDNCGVVQLQLNGGAAQTYTMADLGMNTAVVTATDNAGNTSSCVTIVNVLDSNMVVCDSIGFVSVDTVTTTSAQVSWQQFGSFAQFYQVRYGVPGTVPVIVNSSSTFTFLNNLMPGTCYNLDVRVVCDSAAGNFGPWSNQIIFCTDSANVDNIAPTALCRDTVVFLTANGLVNVTPDMIDGGSFDNVGVTNLLINGVPSMPFSCGDLGPNPVILTVQDAAGNTNTCAANVTVDDVISPVAVCSGQFTLYLNPNGIANLSAAAVGPNSFDNCGVIQLLINGNTSIQYTQADLGVNNVTLQVFDPLGNSDTCMTTVVIRDSSMTPICDTVTNFIIDTVGNNFAFFLWDSVPSAQSYLLRYRSLNAMGMPASAYVYQSTLFNNDGFFQLDPATCYEVDIQTICANGDSSTWANYSTFCTGNISFQCNRPTSTNSLAFTDTISQTSQITLSWNRTNASNGYEVRFRPIGGTGYDFRFASDTFALLRQLQPGTCYEYNVRSICDSTISGLLTYSFWSIVDTVCTPFNRLAPNGQNTPSALGALNSTALGGELFPNPTTGQVTVRFNQTLDDRNYTVRVFNVWGVELAPSITNRSLNGFEAQLSDVPTGLYMIEITTDQQRWTTPVQVTR